MKNTFTLFGRLMTHIIRSPDTILSAMIQPIAIMLLFVYVFGGAIKASLPDGMNYVNYQLPGILIMVVAYNTSYAGLSFVIVGACSRFDYVQHFHACDNLRRCGDYRIPLRREHP